MDVDHGQVVDPSLEDVTVTLPFPEAGVRLLPQNSLGMFASTMQTYRERLQKAARELGGQYDTMKPEAEHRFGTLVNASDSKGLTALHVACAAGQLPVVEK